MLLQGFHKSSEAAEAESELGLVHAPWATSLQALCIGTKADVVAVDVGEMQLLRQVNTFSHKGTNQFSAWDIFVAPSLGTPTLGYQSVLLQYLDCHLDKLPIIRQQLTHWTDFQVVTVASANACR